MGENHCFVGDSDDDPIVGISSYGLQTDEGRRRIDTKIRTRLIIELINSEGIFSIVEI